MGEMRNTCNIFTGKLEGKSPHRRPRCRWEVNIWMDCRDRGWENVGWMHLAQD